MHAAAVRHHAQPVRPASATAGAASLLRRPHRRGAAGRRRLERRPVRGRGAGRRAARPRRLRHEGRHRRLRRRRGRRISPPGRAGSISLLITGDEEGPATDGTVRVLEWMAAQRPDPGSLPGRRADQPGRARRRHQDRPPRQPERARSPCTAPRATSPIRTRPTTRCTGWSAALAALTAAPLDAGSEWFEPSTPAGHQRRRRQPGDQRHPGRRAARGSTSASTTCTRGAAPAKPGCAPRSAAHCRALRPRRGGQRRGVPDRARPAGRRAAPRDRRARPGASRGSTPAAAPPTRASSPATARWPSSAWSAPPCTRWTSACRWPSCARLAAIYRAVLAAFVVSSRNPLIGVWPASRAAAADGHGALRRHHAVVPGQPGAADRLPARRRADRCCCGTGRCRRSTCSA